MFRDMFAKWTDLEDLACNLTVKTKLIKFNRQMHQVVIWNFRGQNLPSKVLSQTPHPFTVYLYVCVGQQDGK